ncbi:hypothetical protein [Streptomyces sp. NPDC057301]|uniref:hypothetical protein n=1 Tax=Streptomyces sp. NPDC057301 TaxID=3346093 RepID=UPI00362C3F80
MSHVALDAAQYRRCGDEQRHGEPGTQQQRADGRAGKDRHESGGAVRLGGVRRAAAQLRVSDQVTSVPVTNVVSRPAPSRRIVALRTPMARAVRAITA